MSFLWTTIVYLPSWIVILLVRIYQGTLSPLVGRQCRFQPTCSNYMIGAVQKYGVLRGVLKGGVAHRPLPPLEPRRLRPALNCPHKAGDGIAGPGRKVVDGIAVWPS